jgi:phosphate transport system substrate-binding protein
LPVKRRVGVVVGCLSVILGACSYLRALPATPDVEAALSAGLPGASERTIHAGSIARDYPRVDGSTSAKPLQVLVACTLLGVPCDWQEGTPLDWTRTIAPGLESDASAEAIERIFGIQHSGTHGAYLSLIESNSDFILVAREPSADEILAARSLRVHLDSRPVALDAFVFLVSRQNSLDSLSTEAIRDVYTGQFTRWSELGASIGDGGPEADTINAYSRNRNSGSQELMEKLVMRGARMIEAPDMMLPSMMGPLSAIASDPSGIGYSVFYYASFMLPTEGVKLIGVDGVEPTSNTIADRSYPYTTEVYAVIREDMDSEHPAVLLRDWLLSDEGQTVVEESGYVPVDLQ